MSDRLPRSNSQSHLPNYGQGQSDNKNDVDKKKDGAPAQSDKNTGQGHSDNNKAAPQMRSKEKKEKVPSESDSDDGGVEYGANFTNILFGRKEDERVEINTFQRMFLGAKPSQAAQKFKNENESSSEDDVMSHQAKMPKSPRQQQSDNKQKSSTKKVPKLQLPKFGNALGSLASDRREMAISPRKTKRETLGDAQDSISSMRNTASTAGTTTANTTATTANTAVGNAAILHTTSVVTAPLWQTASPRSQWNTTSQLNPPESAKSTETTTTKIIATSTNTKNDPVTQALLNKQKTTDKVLESKQPLTQSSVPASLLPSAVIETIHSLRNGRRVTGDQIAELLICMESRGYTLPLKSGLVSTILRGTMTVEGLKDPENTENKLKVNIVELVNEKFIQNYLNVKDLRKFVDIMAVQYKKIAMNFDDEIKSSNFKELRKNKIFVKPMKPLVDSFIKKFFGKEMKLSSSGFSSEFKNFLQGIDTCVVKWAEATGDVKPDLLLNARKSAMAAYIGTRAITPIMRDQLCKDKNYESDRLDILNGYLNTLLTTQTDDFYFDIMGNTKNQDDAQKNLINAHKKASALQQREKSLENRREKISFRLESDASISPREKVKSPRKENLDKRSENLNATRQNIRNKSVSNFIKISKIKKPDSDFLRHFRESLWVATRDQYQEFKNNPAEYMLGALEKYMKAYPSKLNSSINFLLPMKDELKNLVDQKNEVSLAAKTASAASVSQTTTSVTSQTQATQVTDSTSLLMSQKSISDETHEQGDDDLSASSDAAELKDAAESSFDESTPELPINENEIQKKPGDSSMSLEKIDLGGTEKSPSDDSVAEPTTAEEATPDVPGNLSAALEKIDQRGLRDSPFDDSEFSSSQ